MVAEIRFPVYTISRVFPIQSLVELWNYKFLAETSALMSGQLDRGGTCWVLDWTNSEVPIVYVGRHTT